MFLAQYEMLLTPTGRCTTKYFPGVFIVGVQYESLGHGQPTFVRVEPDERRLAAVIHFCIVASGKSERLELRSGRKHARECRS